MIIAIEGIDGSGKATQCSLLLEYFKKNYNKKVDAISFPRYGNGLFSLEIKKYLNGAYGKIGTIPHELLSILFAGDRFESKSEIECKINENDILLVDRYVASNIAHQGAYLNEESLLEFSNWIQKLEYDIFKIPKPDLVIFYDITPEMSWHLISKKSKRNYTNKNRDLHESDSNYLKKVYSSYKLISKRQQNWVTVPCVVDGVLLSQNEILDTTIEKIISNINLR